MDKEEQIEEIKNTVRHAFCEADSLPFLEETEHIAEAIYNAGYRKQDDFQTLDDAISIAVFLKKQKAENDILRSENEQIRQNCITHEAHKTLLVDERAKVIKEFAEKAQHRINELNNDGIFVYYSAYSSTFDMIDEIVKEMTEATE